VTAAGITLNVVGTFNPQGMNRPIGSICWKNTPTCNTGALLFEQTLLKNTIPDGVDATPALMTDSNGGAPSAVAFTYQGVGGPITASIPIQDPLVKIEPGSAPGTHDIFFNVSAIYTYLGFPGTGFSPCPLSVGYCTGINNFYTTGEAVSDCTTFKNPGVITTDVYFSNGSLAEAGLE